MRFQLAIGCFVALAGLACARDPSEQLCERVAPTSEFYDHDGDECTVSCYLSYLGSFRAHRELGAACDHGHGLCALGECRDPDAYELPELLDDYEIRIKEARVTRADELTGTDSDPFVVVTLVRGSGASFSTGTRLCRTPTIWQKARPKWDFSCRRVALERGAVLKFSVYDMDTMAAELLGDVTKRLSELLREDEAEAELELVNGYKGANDQTLTVEVMRRRLRLPSKPANFHHRDRQPEAREPEGDREGESPRDRDEADEEQRD